MRAFLIAIAIGLCLGAFQFKTEYETNWDTMETDPMFSLGEVTLFQEIKGKKVFSVPVSISTDEVVEKDYVFYFFEGKCVGATGQKGPIEPGDFSKQETFLAGLSERSLESHLKSNKTVTPGD